AAFVHCEPKLLAGLLQLADPDQELAEMEADALRAREAGRQRAKPGERQRRLCLREQSDGRCHRWLGFGRREPRGRSELALGGDRPAETLQRGTVEELRTNAFAAGPTGERGELSRRR